MDAHHDIPELDRRGLREFAFVTGGVVAILFGVFFPWLLEFAAPIWPWLVAGVLVAWGAIAPRSLRPVYYWWMRFGLLLSRITTPVVLGIVFFAVITPTALMMRLVKRDTMARDFPGDTDTYKIPSRKQPPEKMEKPF